MIFIFEDHEETPISRMQTFGIKERVDTVVVYSRGNQNLLEKLVGYADKFPRELIVIFMDIIPDNDETFTVYDTLVTVINTKKYNAVVVPNLGQEYAACMAFAGHPVWKKGVDPSDLERYSHDFSWASDRRYSSRRNYEKLTKHFAYGCTINCMHKKQFTFYLCDCHDCSFAVHGKCNPHSISAYSDKARCFVEAIVGLNECFYSDGRELKELLLQLNEQLCDAHNARVQSYAKTNTAERATLCREIYPQATYVNVIKPPDKGDSGSQGGGFTSMIDKCVSYGGASYSPVSRMDLCSPHTKK